MLRTLRALASDLIAETRRLDRRITATAAEITTAVQASGTTLTPAVRDRKPVSRQDPRSGRIHPPVPLRRGLRLLHRHRPG